MMMIEQNIGFELCCGCEKARSIKAVSDLHSGWVLFWHEIRACICPDLLYYDTRTSIPLLHLEHHRLQLVLQPWRCRYHRLSEAGKRTQ